MDSSTTTDHTTIVRRWLAQVTESAERDQYTAKRQVLRTAWDNTIMVRFVDEPQREPLFVHARDLSEQGIGFFARQPVDLHTRLVLSADNPDETVSATVRRCTVTLGGYVVGADFDV